MLVGSLLGLVLTGLPVTAAAQIHVASEERFFKIEWQIERVDAPAPVIVGSVSNPYLYPVQRVRSSQVVAGQVSHESFEAVGDVSPGGRRTFRLELPATAARLRVTVHSFEFGTAQSP